jgi:hypothetical protein
MVYIAAGGLGESGQGKDYGCGVSWARQPELPERSSGITINMRQTLPGVLLERFNVVKGILFNSAVFCRLSTRTFQRYNTSFTWNKPQIKEILHICPFKLGKQ